MKTQNYRQAVESIDEALKNNSSSFETWLIRAQIWQYLKEPGKAEESFQRALSLAPGSNMAVFERTKQSRGKLSACFVFGS